jgi:hypothetical protein
MGWRAFDAFIFEPIHFAMERKMMVGIAERAEGTRVPSYAEDAAVVMTWCVAALAMRLWGRRPVTWSARLRPVL